MKKAPVIRDLFNASWISAVIAGGLAFMVIDISAHTNTPVIGYSLFVCFRFFVQGLINMAILAFFMDLRSGAVDRSRRVSGALLSYGLAFLWAFFCSPFEIMLAHIGDRTTVWTGLPSTIVQAFLNNSLVWIAHAFVILRHERLSAQIENATLRAAHLEATNLLLRQQMNPHFLFNSLTILKSLYRSDSEGGEQYLVHLVGFLRASMSNPDVRLSSLASELKVCLDYLEMQRIRFDSALEYSVNIPDDIAAAGHVPPFALQSLVENAIKHNEVTDLSPLHIGIFVEDGRVITTNNLQLRSSPESPAVGRGLANLVERYRILSGDEVIIRQLPSQFSVSIKILSNEDCHHRR